MKTGAVIVAAGEGRRMGGGREKLFLDLEGEPILAVTLLNFQNCPEIDEIVLVLNPALKERFESEIGGRHKLTKLIAVTDGGPRRQDSVHNGLLAFPEPPEIILVHDGDRPFASPGLIGEVARKSREGSAIAAVPAKDTIKLVGEEDYIVKTVERKTVWLAQTPQGFPYEELIAAHRRAEENGWEVTDDASLIERCEGRVKVVEGSYDNIKITTSGDYELAKIIQRRIGAEKAG